MEYENNLKIIMEEKNVSIDELCFMTGLTHMTIRRILKGDNTTLSTMRVISKALKAAIPSIWKFDSFEEAA